jgi:hypothetical protein
MLIYIIAFFHAAFNRYGITYRKNPVKPPPIMKNAISCGLTRRRQFITI